MRTPDERRRRVADGVCSLTGIREPAARHAIERMVGAWMRRQAQSEAIALGYLDIGGEA